MSNVRRRRPLPTINRSFSRFQFAPKRLGLAVAIVIAALCAAALALTVDFGRFVPTAHAIDRGAGSVSLTTLGAAATQNLNTLSNTAGSTTNEALPTGWYITESGGGARDNDQYAVDTGGSNTGDTFSYGAAGNTDRALGGLQSGTLIPIFGAQFTNNTGATITSLDIAYTGEQWRIGNTAAARDDRLDFQISTNATNLCGPDSGTCVGTYTDVNTLDFTNPVKTAAAAGALDGNSAANRTAISTTISSLNIPNGATFWIRWNDLNASGADDGLSIDDFSITPQGSGPPLPNLTVTDVSQTETNGATTFTFQVNLSAPAGPGGVTFDIATADGTAQDDNPAVSEDNDYVAQSLTPPFATIAAGNSSFPFNVTVNGDVIPETDETFFVNVTNVTGANVTDGQGQGTIQNDDVSCASLSINDVTQTETNAGTTTFAFTVSLSQAGCGTVTFDIATADGTAQDDNPATEDNDYVAQSLTGQTITFPSTYTFNVTVNGDTTSEPDETFFVNISNVSPGNVQVADGQGLGTITNDDFTLIHDVQGNGAASPIVGSSVTVRGIVTLLKSNGFFIQEEVGDNDADTNTSEGIFVFTSSAPTVAVGDQATVTATVVEFNSLTELSSPTVSVNSSGNTLPTAVTLDSVILDPAAAPTQPQLEKYESMRMTGSLKTVEPNNQFFEVFTVLQSVARPMREPGIPVSDPIPPDPTSGLPDCCIPTWDENPERLMVDTDGRAGSTGLTLISNVSLGTVTGPLDYAFGSYRLIPDAVLTPSSNMAATPLPTPLASEFTIASYNIENFVNNATQREKVSLTVRTILHYPDVIGVVEIDDLTHLQALATDINNDAVAASNPNPMYVAYLTEGNVEGGGDQNQNVGFLVKTTRLTSITVTQEREEETYLPPGGSTTFLHDRPPLVLDGIVDASGPNPRRVIVVVNHLRSFIDVELVAGDGPRVREKRKKQAESLADLLNDLQTANPGVPVISVGDYNAYQFNSGYDDSLSVIKGNPTPDDQIVVDDSPDLVNPNFTNLTDTQAADERYSFIFEGTPQALDHHVVNTDALARNTRIVVARVNSDYPETPAATYASNVATPERNSDHDPVVSYFNLALANVSITKTLDTSGPYFAGGTVTYTLNVANAGPDTATNIQVTDTTTNLTITSVSGSGCAALPCTITSLAAGADTDITVNATIDAPGAFDNSATATAAETDPNTADNTDSTGNGGNTAPLPTLAIDDVTLAEGDGGTTAFTFSVTKTGAGAATVQFTTNNGSATLLNNDYQSNSGMLTFASADTTQQITVLVNGDTTPEANETFTVDLSSPSGATITDGSGLGTINNDDQSANSGDVIISELRFRGPGTASEPVTVMSQKTGKTGISTPVLIAATNQAEDEFVEIYNNSNSDITVFTTDGSDGWTLVASTGSELCRIDNGTVLPARSHYLCTNAAGYSLDAYASGDTAWLGTDIPDGGGVALFRTNNPPNYTLANRLDAAGYVGVDPLYREGAGFPTGGAEMSGGLEYAFLRSMTRATNGLPKDTGDNTADFMGVTTDGTATGLGPQNLGAPGPENLSSPVNVNAMIAGFLLDRTKLSSQDPNRVRNLTPVTNGMFGTMAMRIRVVNNTGAPVSRLRFRIIEVTTFNQPGFADLRALTSSDTSAGGVMDVDTCAAEAGSPPCTVTIKGTTLEIPPAQASGGGWNSTMSVTLGTPLPAGSSLNLQFLLGVQQTGSFRFFVNVEALP